MLFFLFTPFQILVINLRSSPEGTSPVSHVSTRHFRPLHDVIRVFYLEFIQEELEPPCEVFYGSLWLSRSLISIYYSNPAVCPSFWAASVCGSQNNPVLWCDGKNWKHLQNERVYFWMKLGRQWMEHSCPVWVQPALVGNMPFKLSFCTKHSVGLQQV